MLIKRLVIALEGIAESLKLFVKDFELEDESNLILTIGDIKMNPQLATNQQAPYVVNHLDGSPLKTGNTIRVSSSDPTGASLVPDAAPLAGLGTGFVVGGTSLQTGLKITADELDSTGAVIDTTSVLIDIVAATVPPGSNLSLTLGVAVTKPPVATAANFANPFGR